MHLGTASWTEGPGERRALVAQLESGRLVDLNRLEAVRLRRLGEGQPERLAEVLVPPSLRLVLEGGARALARVRQTVAYAEKWDRRGTLPEVLGPGPEGIVLHPCLPRPSALSQADGRPLDRFTVRGAGATLSGLPRPGLAVIGLEGGGPAGYCLAFEDEAGPVLGHWMSEAWPGSPLALKVGTAHRSVLVDAWEGLELPPLRPGEVCLLPPAKVKPLQGLEPGQEVVLVGDFDRLPVRLGEDGLHLTVQ